MKVLCLVQLPPPIHGAAVMNKYIIETVLPNSGFEFELLELNFSKSFQEMHEESHNKVLKAAAIFFRLLYKLLFYRPDVVYFTFAPFGAALIRDSVYVCLCRIFRVYILFHLHGTGLSKRKSFLYRAVYKFLFCRDRLILLSESLYSDVSNYIKKSNCFFLANAVESSRTDNLFKKTTDSIEILYLANYHPAKGLLTVIDVFTRLAEKRQDIRLRLVGEYTYYWSERQMEEYISRLPKMISDRIIVYGPAYGEEKIDILDKADIFFYPSLHDAFPLVVLEAMSFGLPVIGSCQGALPDIIEDGKSGYVYDGDDDSFFEKALNQLSENYELRKKMSMNALDRFEKYFSFPIFNNKFINILKTYDNSN